MTLPALMQVKAPLWRFFSPRTSLSLLSSMQCSCIYSGYKRDSISHSITQGSFEHPCVYLAAAGGQPAGFDSGLQTGGQFSIKITNDKQRKHGIFVFLLYWCCRRRLTKKCDSHLVLLQ